MTIDSQKRTTMKILAAASGAMAAPGFVAAACQHGNKKQYNAGNPLAGTGLVISFSDAPSSGNTRQIIITNTSNKPVRLSHVYPGIVSTPEGSYDINTLLTDGAIEFAPKQATTLTIKTVNTASVGMQLPPATDAETWVSIRTRAAHVDGGQHVTTVRHMYA